jgi:hypothetical protein
MSTSAMSGSVRSDGFAFVPHRLRWRLRAAESGELTRDQRAELVATWLRIAPSWSDRSIAAECGVSHQTVGRLRARLDHSSGSGDDARIRMVGPFSDGFGDSADGGRRHDSLAMMLSTAERERAARWVPRTGHGSPNLPSDPQAAATILRRRALRVERIERRQNMLTNLSNAERLDRLERALSIRMGVDLQKFGAGPSAVSPAPVAPDEDTGADIYPVAA